MSCGKNHIGSTLDSLLEETGDKEQVESIARKKLGCSESIADQIASLKELKDGWLEGSGHAYEVAILDWMQHVVQEMINKFNLPVPYIYPTVDNNVTIEWPFGVWEVSLEVMENKHARCYAYCDDIDSFICDPEDVNDIMLDDNGIERFGKFIESFIH